MLRATLAASRRLARPAILAAGAGATLAASAPLSSCASKQEKPLTLVYFSVRAMAECPRMILEYGNIAYEDVGPTTWFGVGWKDAKKLTPFNQLPLLYVQGHDAPIAQMGAIARYCASLVPGLVPSDPLERARCDMIFESAREFDTNNPIVNVYRGEQFEAKKAENWKWVPTKVANLAAQLENRRFFCGGSVRFCDFMVYHALSNARTLEPTVLDAHPNLVYFMKTIEALPGAGKYIQERPTPVDIGVKPMLEPNVAGLRARK